MFWACWLSEFLSELFVCLLIYHWEGKVVLLNCVGWFMFSFGLKKIAFWNQRCLFWAFSEEFVDMVPLCCQRLALNDHPVWILSVWICWRPASESAWLILYEWLTRSLVVFVAEATSNDYFMLIKRVLVSYAMANCY